MIVPLCCLFSLLALSLSASGQSTSFFTLVNTVPKSSGFSCHITNGKETNVIVAPSAAGSDEAAGNGFSTGTIPWLPADGRLVAQVPGKPPVELKQLPEGKGSSILLLRQTSAGRIDFSTLAPPASRESAFYDAVNLTAQSSLVVDVEGKKVALPQGKRVRLGTKNNLKYGVPGGPHDELESVRPPQHVLIFTADDSGKVACMVVADP